MWVVMDCQTAIEYINLHVDNMLDDACTQQLFEHISTCEHCRRELDGTLMLKKALSNFDELEPPAGLALGAIRKAKKRKLPVFAYASAAVAAAITLIAVFSSSIFPNNYGESGASVAFDKSYAAQEMEAPKAAPEPNLAAAPAATEAPAAGNESVTLGIGAPQDSIVRTESDNGAPVYINVPSESCGSAVNAASITVSLFLAKARVNPA
jgi:anti-sigma factor RsiW